MVVIKGSQLPRDAQNGNSAMGSSWALFSSSIIPFQKKHPIFQGTSQGLRDKSLTKGLVSRGPRCPPRFSLRATQCEAQLLAHAAERQCECVSCRPVCPVWGSDTPQGDPEMPMMCGSWLGRRFGSPLRHPAPRETIHDPFLPV